MINKEKIAISAANEWCRCFKCDGRVNATGCACEKDKKLTCHKWYDGFRTAMLALNDYEQQIMNKAVEGKIDITNHKVKFVGIHNELGFASIALPDSIKEDFELLEPVKVAIIKEDTKNDKRRIYAKY